MSNHADRVGQELGDYRLIRRLGGGGFGDVYLGEHRYEHTQVAVKVLQARLTRSADLKEFINEARTIRLNHPHILPLLDFGVGSDETPLFRHRCGTRRAACRTEARSSSRSAATRSTA